jgi:hypothetical protein
VKRQIPVIVVMLAVVVIVIAWFVWSGRDHGGCDTIFEQTAPRLATTLDVIKSKGELVIGREKVQDLAEGSQKVALHLKTCCIAQQRGGMTGAQFQGCIDGAKDYETKVIQVTNTINEAHAARAQGNVQLTEQKAAEARQAAGVAATTAEQLVTGKPPPSRATTAPSPSGPVEQEPNNTILEANPAPLGMPISGEIGVSNDVDYFKYHYDGAQRDVMKVTLQNLSTTLRPDVHVFDDKRSEILRAEDSTPAANLEFFFTVEPGKDFYIEVAPFGGQPSASRYTLSVVPQKAYDAYEPNDGASSATPIQLGQTISANILDKKDVDWYRLRDVRQEEIGVHLENMSSTLLPSIRVYDQNKAELDRKDSFTSGSDLQFTFKAGAGKDFYLAVAANGGTPDRAAYKLTVQ